MVLGLSDDLKRVGDEKILDSSKDLVTVSHAHELFPTRDSKKSVSKMGVCFG